MMSELKNVLIVGGGSSGWLCAAYMNAAVNRHRKVANFRVLESPDIPRIGVGEATIPNIRHILSVVGIPELEFMRATNATFKQSIKYVNWLHHGHQYHHPFSRYRPQPLDLSGPQWLRSDRSVPYMATVSDQPGFCDLGYAPVMLGEWDFGPPLTYAFHLDSLKFANFLRDWSTARGVVHTLANMVDVDLDDAGYISRVKTDQDEQIEADLFVDCTGFASLLIEGKLKEPWEDCSQWLLCNRAVTMHVPYEDFYPGQVRPFTTATALSNGWVWDIPMTTKRSCGYVHSSEYISLEDAEAELRAYCGSQNPDLPVRVVNFKVGRRRRAWVKNCVALGLSGGFIEPLESTGLYLSDLAAVMLSEHFPEHGEMEALSFRFNRIMGNRFYEILDFINLHYCLTKRTDTDFWLEVQKPERIHPRLQAKLDFWKIKPPSPADFQDQCFPGMEAVGGLDLTSGGDSRIAVDTAGLWNHESYECILYGMNFMEEEYSKWASGDLPKTLVLKNVAQRLTYAKQKLAPHDQWLQRVVGMPQYSTVSDPNWCNAEYPRRNPNN